MQPAKSAPAMGFDSPSTVSESGAPAPLTRIVTSEHRRHAVLGIPVLWLRFETALWVHVGVECALQRGELIFRPFSEVVSLFLRCRALARSGGIFCTPDAASTAAAMAPDCNRRGKRPGGKQLSALARARADFGEPVLSFVLGLKGRSGFKLVRMFVRKSSTCRAAHTLLAVWDGAGACGKNHPTVADETLGSTLWRLLSSTEVRTRRALGVANKLSAGSASDMVAQASSSTSSGKQPSIILLPKQPPKGRNG
eukprot:CAMPEP_0115701276 /NCGR_PEP_ID=MMETSP0272-20121206/67868_1 /TAXON_ID=71861 /ORGANISM="Scrippsiella trochoidea, Strain CCMP3099" /LENGTH=252 /DNA_ID=CAMNT_0003141841 /DNA_START=142 /DNA_END=897 /DNA_ORIENTATION=-